VQRHDYFVGELCVGAARGLLPELARSLPTLMCTKGSLSLSHSTLMPDADPRRETRLSGFRRVASATLDRPRVSFRTNICHSTTAPNDFLLAFASVRPSVRPSISPSLALVAELAPRKFNSHASGCASNSCEIHGISRLPTGVPDIYARDFGPIFLPSASRRGQSSELQKR